MHHLNGYVMRMRSGPSTDMHGKQEDKKKVVAKGRNESFDCTVVYRENR